ncbi:uncharacterized protein EI90DRAFT_865814 [Cantharellus anzutake]|uniref:uncharacterized protein n=1 Tax=Cantharellus anzutake TaxID=1750568 RepID=UPI001904FDAC|nr:uncharacterized protein EI90DRAFT_865814 [Cantharellus anzutake]KAF8311909.1 hypothetical protein EI90DRAFT_865814 [Cantharellus anzutake]
MASLVLLIDLAIFRHKTGNRECVWVEMDDEEGKMESWGVGDGPKGVAEHQNGDLGGEKGAKIQKNETSASKITKSTKTHPSNHQNSSKLMQRAHTTQPIILRSIPHQKNHSNDSESSMSPDDSSKMEVGKNFSPRNRPNQSKMTQKAGVNQPMTIRSNHHRSNCKIPSKLSNNFD